MTNHDVASKIIMQGIHLELTEAMQTIIREKLSALLRRNERIIRINFRLHSDQQLGRHHHYSATGEIEIGGPNLVATSEGNDAYNVIEGLVEKLDRLLQQRQGHRKEKRNHPHDIELETELPKVPSSETPES